jgi:hypothetical protein
MLTALRIAVGSVAQKLSGQKANRLQITNILQFEGDCESVQGDGGRRKRVAGLRLYGL